MEPIEKLSVELFQLKAERLELREILSEIMKTKNCLGEIPEEISAQFDIGIDIAHRIHQLSLENE